MSETHIASVEGCAEIVLAVCLERGFRVKLHEPELNSGVKFRIEAPDRKSYREARREWGSRLYIGGKEKFHADSTRVSRTRL